MAAPKPPRPPAFDAKSREKRLYENVRQANGLPYAAFAYETADGEPTGAPRFFQWLRKLRDVVNALAVYVDDYVRFNNSRVTDVAAQVQDVDERLAEVEAARGPFLSGRG